MPWVAMAAMWPSLSVGLHRRVSYTARTVRAIVMETFEDEPKLAHRPLREPGPNDLRVRINASSVNGFDLSVIDGTVRSWMQYELPVTLGRDFAGVVEQVGEGVNTYTPGDEVFGCFFPMTLRDGTWAEHLVVPADMFVALKPAFARVSRGRRLASGRHRRSEDRGHRGSR